MLRARLDSPPMALPDDLRLRTARDTDLPAIASLRESVGWAAHDWALRAVLDPIDARCVVVEDREGSLAGVGSGITYGALGWVGNMVVAEGWRRRGLGAAILADVVDFLLDRGCTRLELFATPSGRPLYARHGFALTDPSVLVRVRRDPFTAMSAATQEIDIREAADPAEVSAYDAPRFGGDRGRLIGMMAADRHRPLLVGCRDGRIAGYLWLRADGPRIGPFLADDTAVAAALLGAAFGRLPGVDELGMNLPTANVRGAGWLGGLGFPLEPWDGRMARGEPIPRRDETIYANLVGALG